MKDIEQLKLVLDTIGNTTESAKWVLLTWLALDLLKILIAWTGGITLAAVIGRHVTSMIMSNMFAGECRDMVIPGMIGTTISHNERARVKKTIQCGLDTIAKEREAAR